MQATVVTRGRRAAAVALLLLVVAFLGQGLSPRYASAATQHRQRDHMLTLTNQDRTERDKAALDLNARLSRYAKAHSRDMAAKGYLFHSTDLPARLKSVDWSIGGENVGVGSTLDGLESAFMRSKDHRKNILRKSFDYAAIGIVKADGSFWVTVIFYG